MIDTLPLSATGPTPHANSVSAAQVMQSGPYQPGCYPYPSGSVQPNAAAGLDIGSLIGMIVPIVMMGMMTRMLSDKGKKDKAENGVEGEVKAEGAAKATK